MQSIIKTGMLVCTMMFSNIIVAYTDLLLSSFSLEVITQIPDSIRAKSLENALSGFKEELIENPSDSIEIFGKIGLISAELKQPKEALEFTQKYINNSADISILHRDSFNQIRDTLEYKTLKNKYLPKGNIMIYIYICIAVIGLYFTIIINFKKDSDWMSNLLIGGFVVVHSLFILDFALYNSNLSYIYPHTFLISTSVALLYGPLLYFYFKRITQQYKFRALDVLHLVPLVVMLFVIIPFYTLSSEEKLKFMFDLSETYSRKELFIFGFLFKLSSYIIYGYFIGRIYFKNKNQIALKNEPIFSQWTRNVFYIHIMFVISYIIYGLTTGIIFTYDSEIINHSQVLVMSLMVLYIAQMAYLNPIVFNIKSIKLNNIGISKYMNSGLTESLSEELKSELIRLFSIEKVYQDNNLSLDTLSQKLNTTRHNTSQIINEQFNMNFFELVNKFRIEEALNLLQEDTYGDLNIIDIAYEVGYNNKVTFNKAFKKETSLTPTQFIDSLNYN